MEPSNRDNDRRSSSRKPASGSNETLKQNIEEEARKARQEAGAEAREKAREGQHRIADEAGAVSDALDAVASQLDDNDREGLARYAREMSRNLANVAGKIEDRSVDQLANDAKRLARNNPALFMLGSIAIGFGLSRFFKASAEHDDDNSLTGTPNQQGEREMPIANTSSPDPQTRDGRDML
ncbi:hypothetical protein [Saccharospirillum sp.]|uniref:hypothetical protein n=1 Tax=Saccharospirillum sp. TaxID=2033801 RepID=UPI0034A08D1F